MSYKKEARYEEEKIEYFKRRKNKKDVEKQQKEEE
jgi:hypothetical protein